MKFRVRNGPWEKIFSGNLEGFEVEMNSNSDGLIIVTVLEKEGEEIKGAVVELFKVFYAEGSIEDFVETLAKEATVILKHEPKETIKFMLLSSSPSYVKYEENVFCDEAEDLMEKLQTSSSMMKDFSKAYDLQLIELNKAPERIKSSFFSNPIIIPLFYPKETTGKTTRQTAQTTTGKGTIMLGLTKANTMINEPFGLMMKTTIFGSTPRDRKHVIHLIAEGTLMSNIPTIIFDWDKSFIGLNKPNPHGKGLKDYYPDLEPMGFPVKHYTKEEINVDLNLISVKGLIELIGMKEGEEQLMISKLIKKTKPKSLEELISAAKKMDVSEETKITSKYRTIRILSLIQTKYPWLFEGQSNTKEMAKQWGTSIGRAEIIHMEGLDDTASILLIHNILKGLSIEYGKRQNSNAMILLPEIKEVLAAKNNSILTTEIIQFLDKLKSFGIGFAVSSDRPIDLRKEIMNISETEIFLINRNDVGVKVANSKQFRIKLRPGSSSCEEK